MRIYVGFIQSRMAFRDQRTPGDYNPSLDGYQEDAVQIVVPVDIPDEGAADRDPREIPEAVFVASNSPDEVYGLAQIIRKGLERQGRFRSVSVGDTVTVGDTMWVCDRIGWSGRYPAPQR